MSTQPIPRKGLPAIDLATGKFTGEVHCLCLTLTDDYGVVFDVCCECWYGRSAIFGMCAPRHRQPKQPSRTNGGGDAPRE